MNPEILKKILQYAPEPPARVWEGISKSLDENLPGDVKEKLLNYEVQPPAGTWNKIEVILNPRGAAVIKGSFYSRSRVAAAAAVIIIAAASILFWNRDTDRSFAGAEVPVADSPGTPNTITPSSPSVTTVEDKTENTDYSPALIASNKPVRVQVKNNTPPKTGIAQPSNSAIHVTERTFIPNHAEEKAIAVASYPMDKYMVYSDDDGNAMRLPKKLFDLISCVKEEIVCQQQIQQMQNKFASYITTNDFTGVMEMLRNLKENK